jgi:hypothetical protein
MREEWSLKHEKALLTCKECIDKYDGFVHIQNVLISSNMLPSLKEQKLKLIEEYARLTSLEYPKVISKFSPPAEGMFSESFTTFSYYSYPTLEAPIPQIYVIIKDKDNKRINSGIFNALSPEYMLVHAFKLLSESLPTVVPMTSVFSDLNINRRSLRHVNYRFIKKLMTFNHTL